MDDLRLDAEYIVVGSGTAGLRAAVDLAEAGPVVVLTKAEITESNSAYAQGGIAAAIGQNDDADQHYADTMAAGAGLCEPAAVRALVEEGPREIERLLQWGADFEKDGQRLLLSREGGHSVPRVVHGNGGLTGQSVVQALLAKVRATSNIRIIPFAFLRDLLVDDGCVTGVQFEQGARVFNCHAKSTLLATGGGAQVYRETTNPGTATGDGLAAAWRAGAELRDMEFVQFHPTVLSIPGAPRFLLSEALRGEGARIVDETGRRFVDELKTRDEVSRAVFTQLNSRPQAKVFLDVTHLPADAIRKKFRHVYTTCLNYGLDITHERIPITPAAHYFMGGVCTDLDGRTLLRRLYAAGEVASAGVHGANRLASNSLLEALVFGRRAAAAMREEKPAHAPRGAVVPQQEGCTGRVDVHRAATQIRETTWRCAGLVRHAEGLKEGMEILSAIEGGEEITVQNLLAVARVIHEAALGRTESRGAHYREDFPAAAPLQVHSHKRIDRPVVFT